MMKTFINEQEKQLASEIYELAKTLPTEALKELKIMLLTAKLLTSNNDADSKKGA